MSRFGVGLRPSLHDDNEDVLILQVKVFLWSFARFGYLGGEGYIQNQHSLFAKMVRVRFRRSDSGLVCAKCSRLREPRARLV